MYKSKKNIYRILRSTRCLRPVHRGGGHRLKHQPVRQLQLRLHGGRGITTRASLAPIRHGTP